VLCGFLSERNSSYGEISPGEFEGSIAISERNPPRGNE
jgi:hypothetical protein